MCHRNLWMAHSERVQYYDTLRDCQSPSGTGQVGNSGLPTILLFLTLGRSFMASGVLKDSGNAHWFEKEVKILKIFRKECGSAEGGGDRSFPRAIRLDPICHFCGHCG